MVGYFSARVRYIFVQEIAARESGKYRTRAYDHIHAERNCGEAEFDLLRCRNATVRIRHQFNVNVLLEEPFVRLVLNVLQVDLARRDAFNECDELTYRLGSRRFESLLESTSESARQLNARQIEGQIELMSAIAASVEKLVEIWILLSIAAQPTARTPGAHNERIVEHSTLEKLVLHVIVEVEELACEAVLLEREDDKIDGVVELGQAAAKGGNHGLLVETRVAHSNCVNEHHVLVDKHARSRRAAVRVVARGERIVLCEIERAVLVEEAVGERRLARASRADEYDALLLIEHSLQTCLVRAHEVMPESAQVRVFESFVLHVVEVQW